MRFQVLALSGGGYLGLYSAKILSELEASTGKPLARCFDLICGTSIGGLLALGLSLEVPAAQMLAEFEAAGGHVFSHRPRPRSRFGQLVDVLRYSLRPKYRDAPLRRVVSSILGDALLGDAKHRVIVPAVNMTRGRVQIFKTDHAEELIMDHRCRMTDVAMATSAAPTYFPLAELNDSLFADGALVANAPDLCGVHEAVHYLGQDIADVHVLSLGTTSSTFSISHRSGRHFGALRWMEEGLILSAMISCQQQLVDNLMKRQLEGRYLRLDHDQSSDQSAALGIDVATKQAQKTLRGLALATYQLHAGSAELKALLDHDAPNPTFYHRSARESDPGSPSQTSGL